MQENASLFFRIARMHGKVSQEMKQLLLRFFSSIFNNNIPQTRLTELTHIITHTIISSMEFDHPGQKSLESSRVQNLVENNVSHAWKHVLDQVRVRRRRQVGVHGPFLLVRFALADKRIDNKVRGLLKVVQRSLQLWKRWMRIKGLKGQLWRLWWRPLRLAN